MKKFDLFLGIVLSWAFAFAVFWVIFFMATPWVISLIPVAALGAWFGLVKVAVYILVAYIGGIMLPIVIGIVGTCIAVAFARH